MFNSKRGPKLRLRLGRDHVCWSSYPHARCRVDIQGVCSVCTQSKRLNGSLRSISSPGADGSHGQRATNSLIDEQLSSAVADAGFSIDVDVYRIDEPLSASCILATHLTDDEMRQVTTYALVFFSSHGLLMVWALFQSYVLAAVGLSFNRVHTVGRD
jgi:hypothetical protein